MKTTKHIYIKLIPIACLLIACFTTCKKFDEDKFYSWRTAKQRLQGEWQITSILQNGNDITSQYTDSLPMPITNYYLWFNNSGQGQKEGLFAINNSSKKRQPAFNDVDISTSEFQFNKKKETIYISGCKKCTNPTISIIILRLLYYPQRLDWVIKKLHKKEMVLEAEKPNNHYRITFTKTRNDFVLL